MQKTSRSYQRLKELVFSGVIPSLVVFAVLFTLILFSWHTAKENLYNEQTQILQRENANITASLTQRIKTYENILRGASGLFRSSTEVTRAEWQRYIQSFEIPQRFPGILGVGFLQRVPADELEEHIKKVRDEGYDSYGITPDHGRSEYYSTLFIETFNGEMPIPYGYDIYTDETRRPAMDAARDNHQFTITDKIILRSEQDMSARHPSFIMFFPIYKADSKIQSIPERREALIGYVYAPFRASDFIESAAQINQMNYGFQLADTSSDGQEIIYQSKAFGTISVPGKRKEIASIPIASKQWQISGVINDSAVNQTIRARPASILFGGTLFCALAAGLVYMIIASRFRAARKKEIKGIQEAKDELLALASHQLRTPATGVKQYVGMLREGFAGPVSDLQKRLLDKAYESNERQLGTINEMLFVARADAGNLKMDFQTFNLTSMVRDIINEQTSSMKSRKQKLHYDAPKTAISLEADPVYIRMAIENVISNASKYTEEGGDIYITLAKRKAGVEVRVKDTGVGVSVKDQALLFKKFSRIDNDLSNQVSGSGIGLYLTKKIVQSHGGKIQFESHVGSGSTVKILLPTQPGHAALS